MIILGLTGGIGSGKTYIANIFKEKGVPIYNSDVRAKELMVTNKLIKSGLVDKFGSKVFINKRLNTKLIADNIFTDKSLVKWINSLVHPVVKSDFEEWVKKQNTRFVIKEAAILIESGAYKQCDKVIVVTAPKDVRIKRVMLRDNMTLESVENRIMNQLPDNERLKYADFIINNDGIKVAEKQVDEIYNNLLRIIIN